MPNLVPISKTVAVIWPFSDFSRWRPSAISDLLYACLDHSQRVFAGLCHCAKFGLNRCSSFDNMQVLIFWALGLEMPIHALFGGVLGVKGEIGNICSFMPLQEWNNQELTSYELNSVKSVLRFSIGTRAKFWVTKKEQELIRRWDSERELFNDDIAHT